MNNETVMWITNDCGVNDETLYYLYYVHILTMQNFLIIVFLYT